MRSMTGHGRGEGRSGAWAAVVECFSVNRKNAEVVFHSDRSAAWLEPSVRERVLAKISRGRVQVNLALAHDDGAPGGILDCERAAAFLREAQALQKKLRLPGEIAISDLLGAPGVVRAAEPTGEGVKEAAMAALGPALEGLLSTRQKEGRTLQAGLAKAVARLAATAKKMVPLARQATLRQRESLLGRIERAGVGISRDDPRFLTEIAILAERADISEELDRIASHVAQFREKLESGGPVARTLEFLAQELGREFNTIGSKSSDASLSRLTIEAKAELDRIREQLANLE